MRSIRLKLLVVALIVLALPAAAQKRRRAAVPDPVPAPLAEPCVDGAEGNEAPRAIPPLSAAEVDRAVKAAARSTSLRTLTIAVVDRAGRILGVFRQPDALPANDDLAVGVARTAAFFSHNQAPLSSRTVRFISGIHFPPGVTNTPNAALYGIENTNRGCSFNAVFNPGKDVPPATLIAGGRCDTTSSAGCGKGIVTGKADDRDSDPGAVLAGGIPIYRIPEALLPEALATKRVSGALVVGAIGVVGSGSADVDEYAAITGAFGAGVPLPGYPLPFPENVFIDGIRLPFLSPNARLRFNPQNGLPSGLEPPPGVTQGSEAGSYAVSPRDGGCAPNGYLVGPRGSTRLAQSEVEAIVQRAIAAARRTRAAIRLPVSRYARMVIAVSDHDGSLLALYRMPDATVFSIDVAVAKSRNVVWFSSDPRDLPGVPPGTMVTNRTLGFGAQPLFPPGIDSRVFRVREGPFFPLFLTDRRNVCSQGSQPVNANQNGIVFFPGASPLVQGGQIVGGLGVSGDGVEQDDYVTVLGGGALIPPQSTWADRISVDGVRLPMFKFPRQPEGVTECDGKPCD